MASSKSSSTSSTPTTAQSTLSAFQQELFTIMNNLQTQANNDGTTESAAFNKFLQAEESLVAKSVDFGGPSPNFTYPTWTGTSGPNGSKSYLTAFTKVIHTVLSQKTASEAEAALLLTELQTNLENEFKQTLTGSNIVKDKITDPTYNQDLILWIQDSIFASSAYLSVDEQEGLANYMTKSVFTAITNKTPDALPSGTTYSKAGNSTKSYSTWVSDQLEAYYKSVTSKGSSNANIDKLTQSILSQLQKSLVQYNSSSEDSIRQWVQTTISTLPSSIKVTNFQKDELVGALEQQVGKMFPQPDASFFYTNMQEILMQNIFNPPVAATTPPTSVPKPLSVDLVNVNGTGTDGTLTAVVTGGDFPVGQAQVYTYAWQNTSKGVKNPDMTTNTATPNVQTGLAPGTYEVYVTDGNGNTASASAQIFASGPAIALSGSVTNVSVSGGNDGAATVAGTGGKKSLTYEWYNKTTDSKVPTPNDTTTTMNTLPAGTYEVTVTDGKGSTANLIFTITQPSYSTSNGIDYVVNQVLTDNGYYDPTLKSNMINAIEKVVQVAISYTFNNLSEYGAQGQLMSSTYDYQMISRVSDNTTALVKALEADYQVNIPQNSSNALAAAQDVTAAAVAFRNFANSLSEISGAFKSENNHGPNPNASSKANKAAGLNYTKIKNLIENNSNTYVKTLDDLGNTAYLSNSSSNVPLVKTAELNAVKLASSTAGLNTSLNKLLTSEQAAAITALKNMKDNAEANFNSVYQNYKTQATAYFAELDSYITANQSFNLDMYQLDSVNSALTNIANAMATGVKHGGYSDINAKS